MNERRRSELLQISHTEWDNGDFLSTVQLPFDHNRRAPIGKPQLYETMFFTGDDARDDDYACWRWATEAEAIAGHDAIVARYVNGEVFDDD